MPGRSHKFLGGNFMKKFFLAMAAIVALTVGTASATPVGTFAFSGGTQTVVAPGNSFTLLPVVLPGDTSAWGTFSGPGTGDFQIVNPFYMYIVGATAGNNFQVTETNVNAGLTFNFGANSSTTAYSFTTTGFSGSSLVSSPSFNVAGAILLGYFTKGADTEVGSITFSFQNPVAPSNTVPTSSTSYSADASTVPEPSTYAMLGTALLGLGLLRRRK